MGTHPIFESDFDCLTEHVEMPGVIHSVPNPNDDVIKAVALQIHQERKLLEQARNEEEAREMEKKRKEDEKRRKVEQQSRSLAAVKEELVTLHSKLDSLKKEKHRLFEEFKKVCEKEKEEQEKQERLNMDNRVGLPPVQSPYLTQSHYDPKGKLSIMPNRPGAPNMYMQNPARPSASRIPNSPQANPYLRPNAQQSRNAYMKLPASPASSIGL